MQKHKTARTFLWLALILLLIGGAISDPTAGFALTALAGVSAIVSIALGSKWLKLFGVLVLLASTSLAMATWQEAKSHQSKYMERVKSKAAANSPATPGPAKP